MIKVTVVDDHPLIVRGVQEALESTGEINVVQKYTRGGDFLADIKSIEADLVLLDVELPDINGFTILRHIRDNDYPFRVVFFTTHTADKDIIDAVRYRVNGYCSKVEPVSALIDVIRSASKGELSFSPVIGHRVSQHLMYDILSAQSENPKQADPQFNRVARLLADGCSIEEISELLGISQSTVSRHIRVIYKIYGAQSRMDFIQKYLAQQINSGGIKR